MDEKTDPFISPAQREYDDAAETTPSFQLPEFEFEAEPDVPRAVIPAALAGATRDELRATGALAGIGFVELDGGGCIYAAYSALRFTPVDGAVDVSIGNQPQFATNSPAGAAAGLRLESSEWLEWLERILETLQAEPDVYSAEIREFDRMVSGSVGGVSLELPCVAGTITYSAAGGISNQPACLVEAFVDLLASQGVTLDPNIVPA